MSAYESRPAEAAPETPAKKSAASLGATDDNGRQPTLFGVDLAIENRDDFWWPAAMRAVKWLADTNTPFEAYDVAELGVPEPDHPNRWGALFRAAYTLGVIQPAGYTQSRRPGRAGGLCRVWTGRST